MIIINKIMNESTTVNYSEPKKKLSFKRLGLCLIIVSGLAYGSTLSLADWQETKFETGHKPWFAAYVDVTSTPAYTFEKKGSSDISDVVLSFIVSSKTEPCTPTWGGYYTMEEAAVALDLDRRIARLQQQGGRMAISFGGALNSELALGCTDEASLLQSYRSVVDRYNINTIDLDLENEGLRNEEASQRRAKVIAGLQNEYRSKDKTLAVWLTLPVAPSGLTTEGTKAVATMLSAGVDLAGVNIMTMDYGGSRDESDTMFVASKKALLETHRQLGILYEQAGISLSSDTIWEKIGATPMIGQNDVVDEIFTLEDAVALNSFSNEQGVGRMSMWSANRDIPCGENYVDVKVVSDLCSGVESPVLAFAQALSKGFDGDLVQNASMLTVSDPTVNVHVVDNPDTSPYRIWNKAGAYLKGTKVVWHGNVYEAKWWTKNDLPDNPVLQAWETPWQLIGPVLPGDKPIQHPTLPTGTYPKWSGKVVYDGGDRVLFEGTPYQAKWWNQGQSPAAAATNGESSPWLPLTEEQVLEILGANSKE